MLLHRIAQNRMKRNKTTVQNHIVLQRTESTLTDWPAILLYLNDDKQLYITFNNNQRTCDPSPGQHPNQLDPPWPDAFFYSWPPSFFAFQPPTKPR